jgi:nucleotide-binding universal stress UspA family protein
MFDHILVPTDFSDESRQAFDIALHIAVPNQSRVTLFHVIEVIAGATFEEFEGFYSRLEKRALKSMDEWIQRSAQHDLLIEKIILYGNRAGEIVKFAANHQVDLIVLNSHKIDVENPGRGWGTISYQVGLLSDCAVMLIK